MSKAQINEGSFVVWPRNLVARDPRIAGSGRRCIDLNVAWATETGLCAKVFVKKGRGIAFSPLSDLYGSGLITENAQIRGKVARCSIKSRTEDGNNLRIQATCATRIVVSQEEFSLRIIDNDGFTRTFVGIPGLEVTYRRCAL
jgi:hypothetical protein